MRISHREPDFIEVFDPLTGRAWGFGIEVEQGARIPKLHTISPAGDMPIDELEHASSLARAEASKQQIADE